MAKSLFKRRKGHSIYLNFTGYRNFQWGGQQKVLSISVKNLTAEPVQVDLFKDIDRSKIQVATSGGDYGGLNRSITAQPFVIKDFKVIAKTREQLDEAFTFTYRDMLGNGAEASIVPSTFSSAMQKIATQIDTLGTGMIVDHNTSIQFTLLPNENITIVMRLGEVVRQFKENYRNATGYDGGYSLQNALQHGNKLVLEYNKS